MTDKERKDTIEDIYALTPLQGGMLFHYLEKSLLSVYVIQNVFHVKGTLDIQKVEMALSFISKRHAVTRTAIVYENMNKPRQVVLRNRKIEYHVSDLSKSHKDEQEREVEEIIRKDVEKGYDLTKDSLIRLTQINLEEDSCKLIWNFHHIIMDGWCLSLLIGDFFKYYKWLAEGKSEDEILEAIEAEKKKGGKYSDYIRWLEAQDQEEGLAYWRELLEGYDDTAQIRSMETPEETKEQMNRLRTSLGKEKSQRLIELAKKNQVTINTITEAAWGVVLQKYNNSEDVIFGKVVSGRNADIEGIENIVGLFVNTIPVRVKSDKETRAKDLWQALQTQANEGNGCHYCSLSEIQKESRQGAGLIQTLFVFENYFIDTERLNAGIGSLPVQMESFREQTNYRITITAYYDEELHLDVMYNPNEYGETEMTWLLERLDQVLAQFIKDDEIKIKDIEMIGEAEKAKVLAEFNDTASECPRDKTVIELFEEQVEKTPDKTAIVYEGTALSYRELNEKANQLAHILREKGVKRDSFAALLCERSLEMIIGIYGILKAGGAYVPIDPEYPEDRIQYIIEDCKPKAVLTYRTQIETSIPAIDLAMPEIWEGTRDNPEHVNKPEDLIYCIYTSGTTGKPKGVMIEHQTISNLILWEYHKDHEMAFEKVAFSTNIAFDVATQEILSTLLCGGTGYIIKDSTKKDAILYTDYLVENGIQTIFNTPSYFDILLYHEENLHKLSKCLNHVFLAGEEFFINKLLLNNKSSNLIRSKSINDIVMHNHYGPTETHVVTANSSAVSSMTSNKMNIGKPIENIQILICSGNLLCGIGVPGELCITGAGLARGYLNQAELTAEKFVYNPYGEGKLYRSGDLARWLPDGNLEYLGRIDEQVKIRGFRIELGEIESVLRKQSGVADVAVIVREVVGDKKICAYLIAEHGHDPDILEVREALRAELPDYMIPAFIMRIEELPFTRNGKLDKRALPEPDALAGREYEPPRNEMERAVIEVFEEVLGVSPIGIEDSFFDLGGDSIKAIMVISKMRKKGYELAVVDLMRQRTAKLICENVDYVGITEISSITPKDNCDISGENLAIGIQNHLEHYGDNYLKAQCFSDCRVLTTNEIFFHQLNSVIVGMLKIERDVNSVSSALKEIISKQGALRIKLNSNKQFLEEYVYTDDWDIPVMEGGFGLSIEEFVRITNGIDFLTGGKLLSRFLILKTDENNCILLSAIHHLIWDQVSQGMLKTMVSDALMNRFITQNDYSYIEYCKNIDNQVDRFEISSEQKAEIEKYIDESQKMSGLISRKNPKCFAAIRIKLNDLYNQKFDGYPIETAMGLLTNLMYSDLPEELLRIPFAVVKHNRNELNNGMLGLAAIMDFSMYNIKGKTQIQSILGKNTAENFAITEKVMLLFQDYGFNPAVSVPIINFLGMYHTSASIEEIPSEKMLVDTMFIETADFAVLMSFHTKNSTLIADICGVNIDEDLIRKVAEKFT